jgi:hypothetical protein
MVLLLGNDGMIWLWIARSDVTREAVEDYPMDVIGESASLSGETAALFLPFQRGCVFLLFSDGLDFLFYLRTPLLVLLVGRTIIEVLQLG